MGENGKGVSEMKCICCGNKDFKKFYQEERPDSIILTCGKCGTIVEVFKTATLEEERLLSGNE